jgi:hypothetical protein
MEREAVAVRAVRRGRRTARPAIAATQHLHVMHRGGASMITIERYRGKRFWAVYEDGALLCVTVYKKGALAVVDRLEKDRLSECRVGQHPAHTTRSGQHQTLSN